MEDKTTEFKCDICGRLCIGKRSLASHRKFHTQKTIGQPQVLEFIRLATEVIGDLRGKVDKLGEMVFIMGDWTKTLADRLAPSPSDLSRLETRFNTFKSEHYDSMGKMLELIRTVNLRQEKFEVEAMVQLYAIEHDMKTRVVKPARKFVSGPKKT